MTAYFEDPVKVLEEALRVEKEGQSFYRKAADQTKSKKGRKIFRSLVEDEAMHQRLIQRELDHLTSEGKWARSAEAAGGAQFDLSVSIFPQGREGLQKAVQADAADTEALIVALEIETKSYDMYRRWAEMATSPASCEMLEFLASQERTHFDLLMANYESMVAFGGWAD